MTHQRARRPRRVRSTVGILSDRHRAGGETPPRTGFIDGAGIASSPAPDAPTLCLLWRAPPLIKAAHLWARPCLAHAYDLGTPWESRSARRRPHLGPAGHAHLGTMVPVKTLSRVSPACSSPTWGRDHPRRASHGALRRRCCALHAVRASSFSAPPCARHPRRLPPVAGPHRHPDLCIARVPSAARKATASSLRPWNWSALTRPGDALVDDLSGGQMRPRRPRRAACARTQASSSSSRPLAGLGATRATCSSPSGRAPTRASLSILVISRPRRGMDSCATPTDALPRVLS